MITHKLTMDLAKFNSITTIHATQFDHYSHQLEISLQENGNNWSIPQTASVQVQYSKADGTGRKYHTLPDGRCAWQIAGNTLTVILEPLVLTVPGAVSLSITLMQGQMQISTFSVIVSVDKALQSQSGQPETTPPLSEMTVEPAEDDIPKVFFGAALPQTKDDTIMTFRYISKTMDFSGYCKTKAQGSSSMNYPKKNQTAKLYRDADCTEELKVNFRGWGPRNKFCFKANWIDLTHARNVVTARLWGDVVKTRQGYAEIPELLRTSPNQGAVDGFPVMVYANGIYQGRYTLNIPKDAWMASMDDELDTHCILCGENYISGCFRAETVIDGSDWTDEIHETVPDAIKTRWNEAIRFVMNSTDEEFVSGIGNYFDLESLIDYYLFGLASCGLDAFGKNQLYMTYDGQKWFASMYDMDSTWGLYFDGSYFVDASYPRTSYQDYVDGDGNLLYIRLENLFVEELKARWAELRKGALSIENILNRFEQFAGICPPWLVAEDYAATTAEGAFTGIPSRDSNNLQQIRAYIKNRLSYADLTIPGLGENEYIYRLTGPVTFDGSTDYILTDVKLFDEPKDFTIMVSMDAEAQNIEGNQPVMITSGWSERFRICHGGDQYWRLVANDKFQTLETDTDGSWTHTWQNTGVIAAVFSQGVFTFGKYYLKNENKVCNITANAENTYTEHADPIYLGALDAWGGGNWWKGTINDLRIYDRALTENEVTALVHEAV